MKVKNYEFLGSFGHGCQPVSQQEIILFGGSNLESLIIDVNSATEDEISVMTFKKSELVMNARFGYESDYVARQFGNFIYAIDSTKMNLHVFSMKDKTWNYSSLYDLGVE